MPSPLRKGTKGAPAGSAQPHHRHPAGAPGGRVGTKGKRTPMPKHECIQNYYNNMSQDRCQGAASDHARRPVHHEAAMVRTTVGALVLDGM